MALNDLQLEAIQEDLSDTRTKKERIKDQMEGLKSFGSTVKDIAIESIPGVSEELATKRIDEALQRGDTTGAVIEGVAGAAGMFPIVGDVAGKVLRSSANALRTPKWFKQTKVDTDLAPDSSRKTQITTTTPTYRKVRDLLPEGKTLDFGSGKGVGAKDVGFDTYEPFPDADFTPNYSSPKDIPDESYDNVTSLNVLNVVKPETRTEIVKDIGRILKPGGTAIITTRGADVFGNAKNPVKGVLGDEPGSVITSSGTYQKGFTKAELKEYVQETLGDKFDVENISGAGQAGVRITKSKNLTATVAEDAAPKVGYNVNKPVFHGTKKDFTRVNLVPEGDADIGFHVGTAKQAENRLPYAGEADTPLKRKEYLEQAEGARVLKLALRENLNPLRIPDMGAFKTPKNWLAQLSVKKSDRDLINFMLQDPDDAKRLSNAARVTLDGEVYYMLPDVSRMGMDEKTWKDIVTLAHNESRTKKGISDLTGSAPSEMEKKRSWFKKLKETVNKNGYDSFVYKNEYEGPFEQADSYMLLEPDQVKGVFGGMTAGDPDLMKNKGGLMLQKGGAVPMKNMSEQMELFEEGGLLDEGGMIDEESGNEVPPGSTREEVRDDIPAQLSEGEFVFPADVVRFIGLEKLMNMRQQAKMGLRMMEEMGQMGNSDEATMPDDIPFDINDLDMEDDEEYNMAVGGFVPPQGSGIAGYQQSQFANYQPTYTPYSMAAMQPTAPTYQVPQQQYVPTMQVPAKLPTFEQFTTAPEGTAPQNREYINPETGERRIFTFIGGNPTTAIPEGFIPISEYTEPEQVTTTPVVGQTRVAEAGGGDMADERRRREEEMYGPGGGRLAIGGQTYGVSFDMPEGFMPGAVSTAMSAFGLLTGGGISDGAIANLQRGENKYSMTGSDYNKLKAAISEHGANSSEVEDAFNKGVRNYADLVERAVVDSGIKRTGQSIEEGLKEAMEKTNQSRTSLIRGAELRRDIEEHNAQVAAEAAKKREQQQVAQVSEEDEYETPTPVSKPSGGGGSVAERQQAQREAQSFTERAVSDVAGRVASGRGFNKGGTATKKMKRGGLASKK